MQGISGILNSSFKKRTILCQQVQAGMIVEYANELILEYWGKKGKEQAKAQFLKNKFLTILTANPAIAQEIKFKKDKIMETINDKFKTRVINQLKIIAGGLDKNEEMH